jgi:PEP-CTERM motif
MTDPAFIPAKATKLALLVALLAAPLMASAVNLVANGSFEADGQTANTWSIHQDLAGWAGGAFGIELRNNVAGQAYEGLNFVELDTTHNSSMFQNIATTLGQQYALSFAYSAREGIAGASNGIEVFWNGVSQGTFTGDGAGSGNVWSVMSLWVTGAANTSMLSFKAMGTDDSLGGSLDAVSVTTAVPEPETWALILGGLGIVGFVARRRRPG